MSLRSLARRVLLSVNKCVKKKDYISFCSIPDFSDNPQALFDYIYHNHTIGDLKICWHIMDASNTRMVCDWLKAEYGKTGVVKVVPKYSLRSIYYFIRSRVIIDSHGMYEFKTDEQLDLYLFHGMPVKNVGYMLHTDLQPVELVGFHYTVTSPYFKKIFEKAFYTDSETISISGMPRNDYLFQPIPSYKGISRYIVFMPTFRKANGKYDFHMEDTEGAANTLFNIKRDDWKRMDSVLKAKDTHMFIKPHPSDQLQNIQYLDTCDYIHIVCDQDLLEQRIPLYKFLGGSMALVTDYSSTYIDYLLTDKPICYFIPDFDEYEKNRGFVFDDFHEMLVGPVCQNAEELLACLESGIQKNDNYARVKEITNTIVGPVSCELILKEFSNAIFSDGRA